MAVTIVVLLILAGVSINLVLGENGLITQAKEARKETLISEEKEGVELAVADARTKENGYQEINEKSLKEAINKQFGDKAQIINNGDGTFIVRFNDSLREYNVTSNEIKNGANWNEIMNSTKAPEEQTTQGVIGIGTDGKSVNMDLWEFNKIDGGYALSYESSLDASNKVAGYKGTIENGRITTSVPMYIKSSENGDNNFIKVISLRDTFFGIDTLEYPPIIPTTVTSLYETFQDCTSLKEMPVIPDSVTNMTSSFYNCQSLKKLTDISDRVTTLNYCFYNIAITDLDIWLGKEVTAMHATFLGCKKLEKIESELPAKLNDLGQTFAYCEKLKKAPEIPYGVQSMSGAFQYCFELETPPTLIPETVTNLQWAFQNCYVLNGTMEIEGCTGNKLYNGYYDYVGVFVGGCTTGKLTLTRTKNDTILDDIITHTNNSNVTIK